MTKTDQTGVEAVALNPHSEKPDLSLPEDYHQHHPEEHPTDWGWHGEWGRAARVAGWVVVVILLLMLTTTHYNLAGAFALVASAAGLAVALVWDMQRRKNAWRQ
jgi:Protein of unknown function (DUF2631)